jgi:hypothetical protein
MNLKHVVLWLAFLPLACGNDDKNAVAPTAEAVDPLTYHAGYWVSETVSEELGVTLTSINDTHVDVTTQRVTVYAQARLPGMVVSPPQLGSGECAVNPNGDTVCFHPNAVYLNGSSVELNEADGTGAWWVKHSWIVDGEGYYNCPLMPPEEEYTSCNDATGSWLNDGISMRMDSAFADEERYNIRTPLLDGDKPQYSVTSYAGAEVNFDLVFDCVEEVSDFDDQARTCPETAESSQ